MASVIPATAVTSRNELERYLGQSLLSEYFDTSGKRPRRLSTSLKSYLLELHTEDVAPEQLQGDDQPFKSVRRTQDEDLWRAQDAAGADYFIDTADKRFAFLHTIAHTNISDRTWKRLTSSVKSADRCWFPSRLLENTRLGSVVGFRLYRQARMEGLELSEDARLLAHDLGRDQPPAFRLSISDWSTAERDLRRIRETEVGDEAALESVNWRQRFSDPSDESGSKFIHDEVWCTGKVTAHGTSWAGHLSNIRQLRTRYRALVEDLESGEIVHWDDERGLVGRPVEIEFSGIGIDDLGALANHISSGEEPFRILGYPNTQRQSRVNISAIDLHTNGRLQIELWSSGLRLYLRAGACGNVIPRFLVNFERYMTSRIRTSIDGQLEG